MRRAGAGELLVVLEEEGAGVALDVALRVDAPLGAVDGALVDGDGPLLVRVVLVAQHRADDEPDDDDHRQQHEHREAAGTRPLRGRGGGGGRGGHGSGGRARTSNSRLQRPVFCQLNYPRSGGRQVTPRRSGRRQHLAHLEAATGAHDRPRVDARADPHGDEHRRDADARATAPSPPPDASPSAMRDGITIGDVNGKMASTRPSGESDALWPTMQAEHEDQRERRDDRARLLLALDQRAEGAGGGEVEDEAHQQPRAAAEHGGAEAGREPAADRDADERRQHADERGCRGRPRPRRSPCRTAARPGRTMASSTSLMRLAFSMAVPLATAIISMSSRR